jgi:hypothetical protein
MLDRADRNNWNNAPQSMLNYTELLRMTYEFYGEDIDASRIRGSFVYSCTVFIIPILFTKL